VNVSVVMMRLLMQRAGLLQGDWWAGGPQYHWAEHLLTEIQDAESSWWGLCTLVPQHRGWNRTLLHSNW